MEQDGYILTHALTHNMAWKIELRRARREGISGLTLSCLQTCIRLWLPPQERYYGT